MEQTIWSKTEWPKKCKDWWTRIPKEICQPIPARSIGMVSWAYSSLLVHNQRSIETSEGNETEESTKKYLTKFCNQPGVKHLSQYFDLNSITRGALLHAGDSKLGHVPYVVWKGLYQLPCQPNEELLDGIPPTWEPLSTKHYWAREQVQN